MHTNRSYGEKETTTEIYIILKKKPIYLIYINWAKPREELFKLDHSKHNLI
jgi:hypothetical protein